MNRSTKDRGDGEKENQKGRNFSVTALTIITMMITVGAYALNSPIWFAVGLVVMIFIHEMGHVLAAKQKGLPVSAPVFIPFVGALITMKRHPTDASTEAYIALGGPLLGTVGAMAAFGLGVYYQWPDLLNVAYTGFFLNLINLLPIHPLDGGRISVAVTRWLWLVGLIGGLGVILYFRSMIFFLIWALFAYNLYNQYVRGKNKERRVSVRTEFEMPAQHLVDSGYLIPGEDHQTRLPFTTYCRLDDPDKKQSVDLEWGIVGFRGQLILPEQAEIHEIRVEKVERRQKADGLYLNLHCVFELIHYVREDYYEVSPSTRWKFGIIYFGLAVFLFGMMRMVNRVAQTMAMGM
ncbi:site-2 protease family protein [Paenibacillus larvae]